MHQEQQQNQQQLNKTTEDFPTQTTTSLTPRSALDSFEKRVKSGFEISDGLTTNPIAINFTRNYSVFCSFHMKLSKKEQAKSSLSLKPPHGAYSSPGPSKSSSQLGHQVQALNRIRYLVSRQHTEQRL